MTIYLIDVSSHQGVIEGDQIRDAGYSGIIVKLTEGTDYHNPYLDHQIAEARNNGLRVGFYHYARQDLTDNFKAEADWFLLWALPRLQPGDLLALDFEQADDRGDLSGWALGWLRYVRGKVGFAPFLYTYPWYAISHLPDVDLRAFPLWYASYPDGVNSPADLGNRPAPQAPAPWDKIVIWQFTGGSPVAGTTFPTDLNRFNGSVSDLEAYGKSPSVEEQIVAHPYGPYSKTLQGGFLKTYQAAGSQAIVLYGYPITEEFTENLGGKDYTVQYFERARFEFNHETSQITFGLVGRELAEQRGYLGVR